MHQAAMHHSKSVTQRTINAWAEAVIVSKEEAAMQARKEQTWNKIHSWLAEDPGGHTKLNAITEPAFLQVRLHAITHTSCRALVQQEAHVGVSILSSCCHLLRSSPRS